MRSGTERILDASQDSAVALGDGGPRRRGRKGPAKSPTVAWATLGTSHPGNTHEETSRRRGSWDAAEGPGGEAGAPRRQGLTPFARRAGPGRKPCAPHTAPLFLGEKDWKVEG